jgi:hypothetical protein
MKCTDETRGILNDFNSEREELEQLSRTEIQNALNSSEELIYAASSLNGRLTNAVPFGN